MSRYLNNIDIETDEHKPNVHMNQNSTNNLSMREVQNDDSLYCFFTRTECGDRVTKDITEQKREGKSPIPTRVTITEVYSQETLMRNKDKSTFLTSEKPLAILEKINMALSKLYRFAK